MASGPEEAPQLVSKPRIIQGPLKEGEIVDGKYQVVAFLGQGGMCLVYPGQAID